MSASGSSRHLRSLGAAAIESLDRHPRQGARLYQQDFIKRLIRQFTQAVLEVAGLTQTGRLTEAAQLLEQTYGDLFGLSSTVVFYSPVDELIQLVSRGDDDDPQRIAALAELLRSEARVSQARGQDFDAHQRRLKSLALHLEAARRAPDIDPDATLEAVLELQAAVQEDGMPAAIQADLFFYLEDTGHYRLALGAILTYLQRAEQPSDVRPYLDAFCRRMLELPEDQLRGGGLSRADVQKALANPPRS